MKGNFSLKSLSSPSPLQLKSSSSPRWMSLRAWKTMTNCSLMLTARGTMFSCFLEWLMNLALLPNTRESTLSYLLSLKVQKRLFSTRFSRSFYRLMLLNTSPRYFITNSPLRMNSCANRPSPALAMPDLPILVFLQRCSALPLFWHQFALPSASSHLSQCSQTPGRHIKPFLKQGHLFSQQVLSPLHRHPLIRSSQCSEHAQVGRQYPRLWHSQSKQLTSLGSLSRKQWWQTELKLSSLSLYFALQCLDLMGFLGVSSAAAVRVSASLASCSASEWQNLKFIFWSRWCSCSRQEKTISQLAQQPSFLALGSSLLLKSKWMRQGSQLNSSMPIFIIPSKMGEKNLLSRLPFSLSHLSSSSRLQQSGEQNSPSAGCCSKITNSCLKSLSAVLLRSSERWVASKGRTY